jgi:hypothetical protein
MKTRIGSLVVVAVALMASGCKMCCHSYDYCSPTNPGESQSEWCGKERRGSILGGYVSSGEEIMPGETITEEPEAPAVPTPAVESKPAAKPIGYSRGNAQAATSARRTR